MSAAELLEERDELIGAIRALLRVVDEEVNPRRTNPDMWTATKAQLMWERIISACNGMGVRVEELDAELEELGQYQYPDEDDLTRREVLRFADYVEEVRNEFDQ